jgi:hypothetical protein
MVLIITINFIENCYKEQSLVLQKGFLQKTFFVPKDDRGLERVVHYKSRTEKNPQIRFAYIINTY